MIHISLGEIKQQPRQEEEEKSLQKMDNNAWHLINNSSLSVDSTTNVDKNNIRPETVK